MDLINRNNCKPISVLDCTCGTGILMKRLKDKGYYIEGLDVNDKMLDKARDKGLEVFQGDIRNFNLNKKYDLIFSFDSFGHLTTDEDLKLALLNISNHLNKNGLFIFDGGTKAKALRMTSEEYTFSSDEYSFLWKNYNHNGRVRVELYIDIKSDNNEFTTVVEKFELCGHDVDEIESAVKKTDLKINFITTEPLVKNGSFICCCKK